jgi:hypothetical protein
MFGDGSLTLREFAMREPLPLARIQEAVLEFLRHRSDAVLFGAQAVNAYVDEPRMTQDVDILSPRAAELAEELRAHLGELFHVAVRVRVVAGGKGFRIFQLREPKNRHLAEVRQASEEIPTRLVADIRVPIPEELIAQKMIALTRRRGQPKSDSDLRDVKLLLLAFPALQKEEGAVRERLIAAGAEAAVMATWEQLARTVIQPPADEDEAD